MAEEDLGGDDPLMTPRRLPFIVKQEVKDEGGEPQLYGENRRETTSALNIRGFTGHDKTFSNMVASQATIESFIVAKP